MKIAIRVDSGSIIGRGHLTRCLTLAHMLKECGATITFICREHPNHLMSCVEESHYNVIRLPCNNIQLKRDDYSTWVGTSSDNDAKEVIDILQQDDFNWLIVDHYGLDENWEQLIAPFVKKIMVIDDLANRRHYCHVILDQNYFGSKTKGRYDHLVLKETVKLLGPRFALLQPEYLAMKRKVEKKNSVEKIMVFFGDCDYFDETSKVIKSLSIPDLSHISVDVILGANHPNPASVKIAVECRPKTILHENAPSLVNFMSTSQLIIGAGGATTWERMSLGVPGLIKIVAENQRELTTRLIDEEYQFGIENNDWQTAIFSLINDPIRLAQISKKGQTLVDGLGTKRVVFTLMGFKNIDLILRPATKEDINLLFDWVSDPLVREMSFFQHQITLAEHQSWFKEKILDSDCVILIAEDTYGLPCGQVRFERNMRNEIYIDISVDKIMRGHDISAKLLAKGIDHICSIWRTGTFVAEVRQENYPSCRLFEKLNFTSVPSIKKNVIRYERPLKKNEYIHHCIT